MDHIHHGAAVVKKGVIEVWVISVPMGVLHVVIDPNTVNEPEGMVVILVVLVKGVVEGVLLYGINADGVRAHLLHLTKPPQIGLLVDSKVRGPLTGFSRAEIDTLDLKGLIATFSPKP